MFAAEVEAWYSSLLQQLARFMVSLETTVYEIPLFLSVSFAG
jgi:hypothetical protein